MRRALLLLLCVLSSVGCSRHTDTSSQERCSLLDAGTPVDPLLLAFLSRARAAHHLADDHEGAGNLAAATSPLAELVAGPLPHANSGELAPEVREVLADTYARLADLRSRLGAFEQALTDVQAGLANAREPNYFQGHLLETEGLVEERHARALESQDPAAAATIRKRAIGLLERAMAVQSAVLAAAPGSSGSPHDSGASVAPAASAR